MICPGNLKRGRGTDPVQVRLMPPLGATGRGMGKRSEGNKEIAMARFKSSRALLTVVVLGLVSTGGWAQEPGDKSNRPTIRVGGEATINAKPDQAELALGVVTQATTGQAAAAQNAQKLDAVLAQLRKVLGSGAEIKTLGYSLTPNYRYPKEGGQPSISGYTASNVVEVKTGDLAQVGKLIDAATQSGANTVQSLRFTLKDEQAAMAQALRAAAVKARAKGIPTTCFGETEYFVYAVKVLE